MAGARCCSAQTLRMYASTLATSKAWLLLPEFPSQC